MKSLDERRGIGPFQVGTMCMLWPRHNERDIATHTAWDKDLNVVRAGVFGLIVEVHRYEQRLLLLETGQLHTVSTWNLIEMSAPQQQEHDLV